MGEDEGRLRRVAWMGEPGRWTLAHLTLDDERALCGLEIPSEEVARRAYDPDAKLCERCLERARDNQ